MKKSRVKIALKTLASRDEAEATATELALAINNRRKLEARLDQEKLKLQQTYAEAFTSLDAKIGVDTEALRAWAEEHPEAFSNGQKSLRLLSGVLGFRTGTPKLCLLSRAWNWEKVLEQVKMYLPNFIRNKPEIDKEAIIAQRQELAKLLPHIGVKVEQGESFYFEPNLAETEARQTVNA